jgi:hypothetical protein
MVLVLLLALSTSGLGLGGLRGRHEWLGAHVKNRRQQKVAASSKVEKEPRGVTEGETLRALSTEQEGWGQNLPKPTYSTHKCTGQVSAPSVVSTQCSRSIHCLTCSDYSLHFLQNWHNPEFQKPYYTKSCHFKNFCYDSDSQRFKYYRRPEEKALDAALQEMDGKAKRWEAWPDFLRLKVRLQPVF